MRIPHRYPTSARANRTLPDARPLPLGAIEARNCQLSPLSVPLIGTLSQSRWAEVDRTSILLVKVDTTEVLCDNSVNGGHLVGECR